VWCCEWHNRKAEKEGKKERVVESCCKLRVVCVEFGHPIMFHSLLRLRDMADCVKAKQEVKPRFGI